MGPLKRLLVSELPREVRVSVLEKWAPPIYKGWTGMRAMWNTCEVCDYLFDHIREMCLNCYNHYQNICVCRECYVHGVHICDICPMCVGSWCVSNQYDSKLCKNWEYKHRTTWFSNLCDFCTWWEIELEIEDHEQFPWLYP